MANNNFLYSYRNQMLEADQKQQDSFDKTLITLSGGALGITFAFIKDIIGDNPIVFPAIICLAWIFWGLSLCLTLFSFYTSHLSLTKLISDIDSTISTNNIEELYRKVPTNSNRKITSLLNILSAVFFVLGVILTAIFSFINIA